MRSEWIKKAAAALLAALLLELIPCQFSFWTTVTKKTEDLTARVEILAGYTAIEELDQDVANDAAAADSGEDVADSAATAAGDQTTEGGSALYLLDGSYLDDAGYLHVPDGSLTLRVKNYKGSLQRIFLNLDFLYNQPVLAEVFARDEGNSYPYSLGDGRILLQSVPENRYLKVYPYGQVSDFYPHPDGGRLWKCCRRKLWRAGCKISWFVCKWNDSIPLSGGTLCGFVGGCVWNAFAEKRQQAASDQL